MPLAFTQTTAPISLPGLRDPGAAQAQRAAVAGHPLLGWLGLAVGGGHLHDATKAHDEVEAKLVFEQFVESLVAEAAVGEDRDLHAVGQHLTEPLEEHVLMLIPPPLQLGLHHRLPEQRRGPTMARDHRKDDGGLVIVIEVGPVERRYDLRPVAEDVRDPTREKGPHWDALVAQQPVHLLHGVLRLQPLSHRERVPDGVDAQGGALQDSDRGAGQRRHALGVQVISEDGGDELRDPVAVEGLVAHEAAA
jgi:hypothetical protein